MTLIKVAVSYITVTWLGPPCTQLSMCWDWHETVVPPKQSKWLSIPWGIPGVFDEGCETQRHCGGHSGEDGDAGVAGSMSLGVPGELRGRERCGPEPPSHPHAAGGRGGEAP